jgi:iron-only hydrogenase group A
MSKKSNVSLKIDGQAVTVPEGTTIMQAAETIGIHIPRLCYHPDLSIVGACRVCIVQIEGMEDFVISCSTNVKSGWVVSTHSHEVSQARRDIVELILDNHPRDCQTCDRNGNCELQALAYRLGIRERLFEGERKRYPIENSSCSVIRDPEKCILCGRCIRVCHEVQGVYNLSQQFRGFNTVVTPAFCANMDDSVCVQCGQCINACPTAAFQEKRHIDRVLEALADSKKQVVVQTAPSIRAALGEEFGLPAGTPCTGKMIHALRQLHFDAIFDTSFGADLTIVEEAHELKRRIEENDRLPLLTSCSPGWINFMEKFYPELIPHASTCRSPMGMLSAMAKTYYAKQIGKDPKDIFMVAVMPCVAKKYEIERPEHYLENIKLTDAVLTTRELAWMIKNVGIDMAHLPDDDFDSPLGEISGAGVIFGTTGGVMEAALRTAAELLNGKASQQIEFKMVRAVKGIREKTVSIDGKTLRVGVANGLNNSKILLNEVLANKTAFHIVELMACPGGCIGGGGQPYPPPGYMVLDPELLKKRAKAIYAEDRRKTVRQSHRNPAIQKIYDDFLGKPNGALAKKLLHTRYEEKKPRGIR